MPVEFSSNLTEHGDEIDTRYNNNITKGDYKIMHNRHLEASLVYALDKVLTSLLVATTAIARETGSVLKSSPAKAPVTYKHESRRYLANGNEEVTVRTYRVDPLNGMLELLKTDIREVPGA